MRYPFLSKSSRGAKGNFRRWVNKAVTTYPAVHRWLEALLLLLLLGSMLGFLLLIIS